MTQDDLGVWVTGAISNERRRQGECVADLRYEGAPSATAGRIDVTGGLMRAWADAYFTYDVPSTGPTRVMARMA
jgi:hypothetical protein